MAELNPRTRFDAVGLNWLHSGATIRSVMGGSSHLLRWKTNFWSQKWTARRKLFLASDLLIQCLRATDQIKFLSPLRQVFFAISPMPPRVLVPIRRPTPSAMKPADLPSLNRCVTALLPCSFRVRPAADRRGRKRVGRVSAHGVVLRFFQWSPPLALWLEVG